MPATRCITCSYDLASLAEDALCPECATPVRLSTRGDLVDEPPRVLSRLHTAPVLLTISLALGLFEIACWAALTFRPSVLAIGLPIVALHALHTIGVLLEVVGFLLIAAPITRPLPIRQELPARRALAACAWTSAVCSVIGLLLSLLTMTTTLWTSSATSAQGTSIVVLYHVMTWSWGVAGLAGLAAWAPALHLLRGVCLRVPDARAARAAQRMIRPSILFLLLVAIVQACNLLAPAPNHVQTILVWTGQLVVSAFLLRVAILARRAIARAGSPPDLDRDAGPPPPAPPLASQP